MELIGPVFCYVSLGISLTYLVFSIYVLRISKCTLDKMFVFVIAVNNLTFLFQVLNAFYLVFKDNLIYEVTLLIVPQMINEYLLDMVYLFYTFEMKYIYLTLFANNMNSCMFQKNQVRLIKYLLLICLSLCFMVTFFVYFMYYQ